MKVLIQKFQNILLSDYRYNVKKYQIFRFLPKLKLIICLKNGIFF